MSSAWSRPLRALATQTAVITIIGLGLAAPATAAQGDAPSDKRNDKAAAAKAEPSQKKSTDKSAPAPKEKSTTSSSQKETRSGSGSTTAPAKDPEDDRRTQTGEQPVSKADQNTGGANGKCSDDDEADEAYFCGSDRTDRPSGNGKGDGEATGKPYQAHKGKADNKNPPGQLENDNSNGYECGGNQGIAKGNPAHTACEDEPIDGGGEPETCPDGSPLPASGDVEDCGQGNETCPDGSPLPTSGNEEDCGQGNETCPDGSPLPASGNEEDCGSGGTPVCVPTLANNFCSDIEGEEICVPTPDNGFCVGGPGAPRPPVGPGAEVAGVETLTAPGAASAAGPSAGALPATGATAAMTALSALAFGMLALGAGLLFYRRANA